MISSQISHNMSSVFGTRIDVVVNNLKVQRTFEKLLLFVSPYCDRRNPHNIIGEVDGNLTIFDLLIGFFPT